MSARLALSLMSLTTRRQKPAVKEQAASSLATLRNIWIEILVSRSANDSVTTKGGTLEVKNTTCEKDIRKREVALPVPIVSLVS